MKFSKRPLPPKLLVELAQALGYSDYPHNRDADPHLNYIQQACTKRIAREEYLSFIIYIIEHFTGNNPSTNSGPRSNIIQDLLQDLETNGYLQIFTDTASDVTKRKVEVEDHVMGILGRWTMLLDQFQPPSGMRPVVTAYDNQAPHTGLVSAYAQTLSNLIQKSGILASYGNLALSHPANMQGEIVKTAMSLVKLLSDVNSGTNNAAASSSTLQGGSTMSSSFASYAPLIDMDLERSSINSESLNAYILSIDAAVDISWTWDLSRHMILTPVNGRHTLEVFAMPCIFNATRCTAQTIGLPPNLATEIKYSYAMLFNAWPRAPRHARRLRFLGIRKICQCWSCAAFRFRNSMLEEYEQWCNDNQRASKTTHGESQSLIDASMATLVQSKPLRDWDPAMFPQLWSRIARLHQHQLTAKPWSIWMLFRDRRDTLQYWTFL
jgi:hypothetical protein